MNLKHAELILKKFHSPIVIKREASMTVAKQLLYASLNPGNFAGWSYGDGVTRGKLGSKDGRKLRGMNVRYDLEWEGFAKC